MSRAAEAGGAARTSLAFVRPNWSTDTPPIAATVAASKPIADRAAAAAAAIHPRELGGACALMIMRSRRHAAGSPCQVLGRSIAAEAQLAFSPSLDLAGVAHHARFRASRRSVNGVRPACRALRLTWRELPRRLHDRAAVSLVSRPPGAGAPTRALLVELAVQLTPRRSEDVRVAAARGRAPSRRRARDLSRAAGLGAPGRRLAAQAPALALDVPTNAASPVPQFGRAPPVAVCERALVLRQDALQLPAPHTQLPIRIVRPLALGGSREVASPLRRTPARHGAIGLPAIMQRAGQLAGTIATGQAGPPRDRGLRGGRRGRLAFYARAPLLAKRAAEMQRIVHARSDRASRAQGLSVYRSSRKGERLVPAGKCPPPERAHQQPLGPPAQSAQRGENSD